MTDVPPPPRPANEPGDDHPRPDTPTEATSASNAPETTQLNAGGVPASGEQYPGPPPGEWPPAPASRGGRLRRMGGRLRGSRVALAVVAVIVAAGLALGGFALAEGGHDGKGGRDGRGTASQRDGRNDNADDNNNGTANGNGNERRGRDGAGTDRGRDNDGAGNGSNNNNNNNNNGNGNGTSGTEQSVLGTITAVSQTSITLRTSGGSPVYPLTATTPVTRNGSAAGVTDLKVGDAVVVHVVTATAGATPVVERISVG